ncbi:MAG: TetR/AcrR family transcriptional regulator [Terracidiphilus sp.]|nr:TetR/AcrR family transcriptional regulator [Terracidiphilus sp.]
MRKTPKLIKSGTEAQILASAATLFASNGYRGVSTRDIAAEAGVNEVTIYRHYPRKRELYVAVLDAALQQVKLRGDLLMRLAEASDARSVVSRSFDLVHSTLSNSPELMRLLQYSTLELGEDIDPLLRRHLGELIEVVARYLEPWVTRGELRCTSAKALILAQVSIVVSHGSLYRLFLRDGSSPEAIFSALADSCDIVVEQAG